jgi:hypothetical protein
MRLAQDPPNFSCMKPFRSTRASALTSIAAAALSLLPSRQPRRVALPALTQAELERLAACVNHDLNDYREDDPLCLEYELAMRAIRKLGETFGLDWQSALLVQ